MLYIETILRAAEIQVYGTTKIEKWGFTINIFWNIGITEVRCGSHVFTWKGVKLTDWNQCEFLTSSLRGSLVNLPGFVTWKVSQLFTALTNNNFTFRYFLSTITAKVILWFIINDIQGCIQASEVTVSNSVNGICQHLLLCYYSHNVNCWRTCIIIIVFAFPVMQIPSTRLQCLTSLSAHNNTVCAYILFICVFKTKHTIWHLTAYFSTRHFTNLSNNFLKFFSFILTGNT